MEQLAQNPPNKYAKLGQLDVWRTVLGHFEHTPESCGPVLLSCKFFNEALLTCNLRLLFKDIEVLPDFCGVRGPLSVKVGCLSVREAYTCKLPPTMVSFEIQDTYSGCFWDDSHQWKNWKDNVDCERKEASSKLVIDASHASKLRHLQVPQCFAVITKPSMLLTQLHSPNIGLCTALTDFPNIEELTVSLFDDQIAQWNKVVPKLQQLTVLDAHKEVLGGVNYTGLFPALRELQVSVPNAASLEQGDASKVSKLTIRMQLSMVDVVPMTYSAVQRFAPNASSIDFVEDVTLRLELALDYSGVLEPTCGIYIDVEKLQASVEYCPLLSVLLLLPTALISICLLKKPNVDLTANLYQMNVVPLVHVNDVHIDSVQYFEEEDAIRFHNYTDTVLMGNLWADVEEDDLSNLRLIVPNCTNFCLNTNFGGLVKPDSFSAGVTMSYTANGWLDDISEFRNCGWSEVSGETLSVWLNDFDDEGYTGIDFIIDLVEGNLDSSTVVLHKE